MSLCWRASFFTPAASRLALGLWKNPGKIPRPILVSTNGLDLWPRTRTIFTFEAESGIRIMLVKLKQGMSSPRA